MQRRYQELIIQEHRRTIVDTWNLAELNGSVTPGEQMVVIIDLKDAAARAFAMKNGNISENSLDERLAMCESHGLPPASIFVTSARAIRDFLVSLNFDQARADKLLVPCHPRVIRLMVMSGGAMNVAEISCGTPAPSLN